MQAWTIKNHEKFCLVRRMSEMREIKTLRLFAPRTKGFKGSSLYTINLKLDQLTFSVHLSIVIFIIVLDVRLSNKSWIVILSHELFCVNIPVSILVNVIKEISLKYNMHFHLHVWIKRADSSLSMV